jgi:hypothetical protein
MMENVFKTQTSFDWLHNEIAQLTVGAAFTFFDDKRFKFETLSIQRCLRNCIDWEYFNTSHKFSDKARNRIRASVEKLIEEASDPTPVEKIEKAEVTRLNLEYYKIMDFSGRQSREKRWEVWCHLLFLKGVAEGAYAILDNVTPEAVAEDFKNIISASIQFPPAYYKAGMEILAHFATIISQKYPDVDNVKVRIEQEGLMVRLVIDTPDGMRDVVEKTLDEYREVITGKRRPEDFLSNPMDVMELRHVLQIAQMKVEHQQEMLMLAAQDNASLREQVAAYRTRDTNALVYMGETVRHEREDAREWRELILKVIESSDEKVRTALLLINRAVESGKIDNRAEFDDAVTTVKNENPSFFTTLLDHVQRKAAEGAANYFVHWFLRMTHMLPQITAVLPQCVKPAPTPPHPHSSRC